MKFLLVVLFCVVFGASALTPCQKEVANSKGLLGEYKPNCQENGDYTPLQCHEAYCWCVDEKSGKALNEKKTVWERQTTCNGMAVSFEGEAATPCQAQVANLKHVPGEFKPVCQENGDYASKQCHEAFCWCVDPKTGEQKGEKTQVLKEETVCDEQKSDDTPCKQQVAAFKGLLGEFKPKCDENGDFSPLQCHEAYCWCVNTKTGKQKGEKRRVWEAETICDGLSSNNFFLELVSKPKGHSCAEELHKKMENPLIGAYVPQCDEAGNYKPTQCNGGIGVCWCVDTISGEKIEGKDEFNC